MSEGQGGQIEINLRNVDIFQDLTPSEISVLEKKMRFARVAARTVFYEPDESNKSLFFIVEGRVRLYHLSADGNIFTTAILEAGSFFGEMMLGRDAYRNYAEAVTDCSICLMSRNEAEENLLGDPRIAFRIIETLGRRLIETEQRLADLILKNIPSRLIALLLQIVRRTNSSEVHLTHEELAQLLGVRRETVTRILNVLQNRNLIEIHRGLIVLLNLEKLERISSE